MVVGCLALNASFEPLTMVPMRRALRLVLDGKAEIVESDPDRLVRSERLTLPRPAKPLRVAGCIAGLHRSG